MPVSLLKQERCFWREKRSRFNKRTKMTDDNGSSWVGASRLLASAVREEVDVAEGRREAESVCPEGATVRVHNVHKASVARIQLLRRLSDQLTTEKWGRRV